MLIDLHVHTNSSDGLYSPSDVVKLAARSGVSVLAVADHDTINGIEEAAAAAESHGIRLVPAVEINCFSGDTEQHILGYFVDHTDAAFQDSLGELQQARLKRMHLVISKLADIGIFLEAGDILRFASRGVVGRPHIARAMVKNGYAGSVREAFDKYIGEGKPAYAPRSRLSPAEAVHIIGRAGGVAVLAHPGLWSNDDLIPGLAGLGVAGLEAYSPDHDKKKVRRYIEIARELGLVVTGGSDFHGWGESHAARLGMVSTPPEDFARLCELKQGRNKIGDMGYGA